MKYPIAYLAGPDVFLENAKEHGQAMIDLCKQYGIVGLFPADDEIFEKISSMYSAGKTKSEIAQMIFEEDVDKIRRCDCVIANLIPFRSPSADPGTTWEMGMAYGLQKPVWGYCSDRRNQEARVADMLGNPSIEKDGCIWASDGMMIDSLGGLDNLMMTRSIVNKHQIANSFEEALNQVHEYYFHQK
jgi:nucleoside 2-deoxyribosyltransferase